MKNKYEFNILDTSIILNALNNYNISDNTIDKKGLESIIKKVERIQNNIINK